MSTLQSVVVFLITLLSAASALAQPKEGAWRVFLDTNVVGVDWIKTMHSEHDERYTVVTVGPNQLGASRLWVPTAPLGFGAGYVLKSGWLLELRAAFGLDLVASKSEEGTPTYVAWSFMPGLSWMPPALEGRLFVKFSPVLDFVQSKRGGARQRYFGGCFSVGAGTFLFTGEHASFDAGVYFEGRFPELDRSDGPKVKYADLRTLARVGLSLWR